MASPDPDLYSPWLRLRLRHGALADGAAVARHLALRPTATTTALMQRFQLRLVPEPDGVLLLAQPRWQTLLAAWLRATGGGPLRLRLLARSQQIWGATALPHDARSSAWQLMGRWGRIGNDWADASPSTAETPATAEVVPSAAGPAKRSVRGGSAKASKADQEAAAAKPGADQATPASARAAPAPPAQNAPAADTALPGKASMIDAPGINTAAASADTRLAFSLKPLAGAALRLLIPPGAEQLALLDERGEALLERSLTPAERDAGRLQQPLDGLPEGLLLPRFDQGPAADPVLWLDPEPQALGLACLWLPSPEPGGPPLELEWALPARATLWHYLLVPSGPQQRLEGLAISGDGCAFQGGDQPETLPDGRTAWRLMADRPLPLAERSAARFRLTGQRIDATGQSHSLRLDPLPTAPLGPVWPLSAAPAAARAGPAASAASALEDPLVGLSEIVVPL